MEKKKKLRIRIKKKTKTKAGGALKVPEDEKKQQLRKQRKRIRAKRRFFAFLLFFVMIGGATAVFKAPVFNIKEIVCVGGEKLSEEEIIKAAKVYKGQNVFLSNIGEIKKNLSNIPYVSESNARRIFPNKIKLWVREAKPRFVVKVGDKFAVCDFEGKVLEQVEENKENLCELKISSEVSAKDGEVISGPDEAEMKKIFDCLNILENNGMLEKTNTIDFSNISDIILYYDGRLKIKLGSASDLDYKLRFAEKVIKENISDMEKATVDYTGDKLYVGPFEDGSSKEEANENKASDSGDEKADNAESSEKESKISEEKKTEE